MNIEINTVDKTITIKENVNLGELFKELEQMFPDLKWREYTLIPSIMSYWNPCPIYPTVPELPYYWTTTSGGDSNDS